MMKLAFLQLFLTVFIVPCISGELCVDTSATLIPAYGNKRIIDPDSVLWTVTLSMPMCLERCYQDPWCLSVNVSPEADTCVGFKKKFEGQTPKTVAALGYRVYEMDKADPSDCSTSCSNKYGPSHCYGTMCRCDIGYSYNGSLCRDIKECSSLLDTLITVYGGFGIDGSASFAYHTDKSLQQCQVLCRDEPLCEVAESKLQGNCYYYKLLELEPVTYLEDSTSTVIQKECNW